MQIQSSKINTNQSKRNHLLDFRSDTVTQPDAGMRSAMASAETGDDVYGDDPSVNKLEETFAHMVGKEASVFFPSGTQSNLSAILTHCGRGDELLVGSTYHTYAFEAGGASALGGVVFCPLPTNDDGSIEPETIYANIKKNDPHFPRTRLLCLENTVSGSAISLVKMQYATEVARKYELSVHLDGARLFNAAIELETSVAELAKVADTVSVCLSKGLGAPAGTMLACSHDNVPLVRRCRKILGGGMRQSGILAAAGLYALSNNVSRLHEDHRRAKSLANMLSPLCSSHNVSVNHHTNMVFFTPDPYDHPLLRQHLSNSGILVTNKAPQMRFVVHLGISDDGINVFADVMKGFYCQGDNPRTDA